MNKKDPFDPGKIKFDHSQDYYDESEYLPFGGTRKKKSIPKLFGTTGISATWIIVGTLICVILLLLFILSRKTGFEKQVNTLETGLSLQEDRLAQLVEINKRLEILDSKENQFEIFKQRFERLEASMALRMDQLEKKLSDIQTQMQAAKLSRQKITPTPESSTPIPKKKLEPPPSPTPEKQVKKRYHKVKPGETLFSISHRYRMSVDELRKLNKLGSGDNIHPDQILVVSASKEG
jgi:LysM repeat protein